MSSDKPEVLTRRGFFKLGAKAATEANNLRSRELAKLWFRPPFALDEISFLDACTKCGDCITVCPAKVIIPLPERYGIRASGTPALDLVNEACLLCEDWACVSACTSGALSMNEIVEDEDGEVDEEEIPLSPMAFAVIDTDTCLPYYGPECGACAGSCPVEGALIWQGTKPVIDLDHCVGCAVCRHACISDPPSIHIMANHLRPSTDPAMDSDNGPD